MLYRHLIAVIAVFVPVHPAWGPGHHKVLTREEIYFNRLEEISRNDSSIRLRCRLFNKHGQLGKWKSGDSVDFDYGALVGMYFEENEGMPLTGCMMSRAAKGRDHVTIYIQNRAKPVWIRTWIVGQARIYFTFGEKGSTKAVYVLNLTVTPRNKAGLTPEEMNAKP